MSDSEVRRVVVADADEGTRSLVKLTLTGDSYEVSDAEDTESALRRIAELRPDLILLEADLPGAGGIRIARSLKSQPETQDALVVLLFDKATPVDQEAGREAGVDEFLAKPFNAFALLKKVDGLTAG